MTYLSEDKIAILGSAGAIGSNMVQTCLTMGLTPNIAMYDPYDKGNQGAAEEMYHCSFPGARVTWTTDIGEALSGARYIISSGGAPRKEGMTREDLLKGNAEIAAQLGTDIKNYSPDTKFVVIIFNPADITGLVTLVNSGLMPNRVATLAALDSTRLQTALSQHFKVAQDDVTGCRTYGGHGEQMAVFASTAQVKGRPLTELIGTDELSNEDWEAIQAHVLGSFLQAAVDLTLYPICGNANRQTTPQTRSRLNGNLHGKSSLSNGSSRSTMLPGAAAELPKLVRKERLELSRLTAQEPKSSASTNSATFANLFLYHNKQLTYCN